MGRNEQVASGIDAERDAAVAAAISRIRASEARGVTPEILRAISAELQVLADQAHLFPLERFPVSSDVVHPLRYLLSVDPGERFALYMMSLAPGTRSQPHDHDTWAVVVAIEGEERNTFYRRADDARTAGRARLEVTGAAMVKPGSPATMMPDAIHAIAVEGSTPTRHLHMYGLSMEHPGNRAGFDLASGTCEPYRSMSITAR